MSVPKRDTASGAGAPTQRAPALARRRRPTTGVTPTRRRLSPALFAALACVGVCSCSHDDNGPLGRTATAKRGRFEINIIEEGSLKAFDSATITAKESGKIEWLAAEGDMVKKGDVLVRLDREELEDQIERYRGDLKDAETKLEDLRESFQKEKEGLEDELSGLRLALELAELRLAMVQKRPLPAAKATAEADLTRRDVLMKDAGAERARRQKLWEARSVSRNEVLQADMLAKVATAYYERQELFYRELCHGATALEIEKAKLDLEMAQLNYQMAEYRVHSQLARLEQDIVRAEMNVENYRSYCRRTQLHIDNRTLYAPHQGMVIRYQSRRWRSGQTKRKVDVGARMWTGAAIIELPNLERMKVRTQVSESNIRLVPLGKEALVQVDLEEVAEVTYHGRVTWIDKIGRDRNSRLDHDERRREGLAGINVFDVEVALDERDPRLKLGAKAKVRIPVQVFDDVVYVPKQAVRFEQGQPVVWVAEGEEKTTRVVTLGDENETDVIVTEGLSGGERVVLR